MLGGGKMIIDLEPLRFIAESDDWYFAIVYPNLQPQMRRAIIRMLATQHAQYERLLWVIQYEKDPKLLQLTFELAGNVRKLLLH